MTHYLLVTLGVAATPLSSTRITCKELTIQNNSAHAANIGDSSVTGVAANPSKGIRLDPTGTNSAAISNYKFGPFEAYNIDLSQIFAFGTQNDHLDVIYVS